MRPLRLSLSSSLGINRWRQKIRRTLQVIGNEMNVLLSTPSVRPREQKNASRKTFNDVMLVFIGFRIMSDAK